MNFNKVPFVLYFPNVLFYGIIKINRNSLKYSEVQEIAEILQYDIKWVDKERD